MSTRPTSDRLRETLFNILAPRIEGARFLDLCAGSGAVGIEALSRGAAHVTFVDRSRNMCKLVEANLELCRIPEAETSVVTADGGDFLRESSLKKHSWDLIFFDPPYANNYTGVLSSISNGALLAKDGWLIVEHLRKNELPEETGALRRRRTLKQGDSALSFYEHKEES